jgi:hypothetical protein
MRYEIKFAMLGIGMIFGIPLSIGHGTTLVTFFGKDGIVMAADNQMIRESDIGTPDKPYIQETQVAEPKVVICNRTLLCGTAGMNPISIHADTVQIEYHFEQWLPITEAQTPVRDYADLVQKKARLTLHDMESVIKEDKFWKSQISNSPILVDYEIAGYTEDTPQFCRVQIQIDREKRRLVYPDIDCRLPPIPGGIGMSHGYIFGITDNIAKAQTPGTPQAVRLSELLFEAEITRISLLTDAPASLNDAITRAAAYIWLEGELQPKYVGHTATVGVICKGRKPAIVQFAHAK